MASSTHTQAPPDSRLDIPSDEHLFDERLYDTLRALNTATYMMRSDTDRHDLRQRLLEMRLAAYEMEELFSRVSEITHRIEALIDKTPSDNEDVMYIIEPAKVDYNL